MPRRLAQTWHEPAWATWLDYWNRVEQRVRWSIIDRAETLHDHLEPGRSYPNAYLQFRLTRKRREDEMTGTAEASAARADLRLLIDALSRTSPRPLDASREQALLAVWAQRLEVSTRTLDRWRGRGLRWRWVQAEPAKRAAGGKRQPRLALDAVAIEQFDSEHPNVLERAAAFSRMTLGERQAAVEAVRAVRAGLPQAPARAVLTQAAARVGRSVETLRQVVERHDEAWPAEAVERLFPPRPTVKRADRRAWLRAVRSGSSLAEVAAAAERPVAVVRRGVLQRRAGAASRVRITWAHSPLFERADAAAVFLRPLPVPPAARTTPRVLPLELSDLFAASGHADPHLASRFRRWHFLKHEAARLREPWSKAEGCPTRAGLEAFADLLRQAGDTRAELWRAGLPAVLAVARRCQPESDAHHHALHRMLISGAGLVARSLPDFDPFGDTSWEAFLRPRLTRTLSLIGGEAPQAAPRRTPQMLRRRVLIAGRVGGRFDQDASPAPSPGPATPALTPRPAGGAAARQSDG